VGHTTRGNQKDKKREKLPSYVAGGGVGGAELSSAYPDFVRWAALSSSGGGVEESGRPSAAAVVAGGGCRT
jgi:hypothetical protein